MGAMGGRLASSRCRCLRDAGATLRVRSLPPRMGGPAHAAVARVELRDEEGQPTRPARRGDPRGRKRSLMSALGDLIRALPQRQA